MSAMTTYLYHKRHLKTNLNYFGKTINDPYKYTGSGMYWKAHLKKHGNKIETVQVWAFENLDECSTFALEFSAKHNIVESEDWANLIEEDGKGGGMPKGRTRSKEHCKNISKSKIGKPSSNEVKEHLEKYRKQRTYSPLSNETKIKISKKKIGKLASTETKNKLVIARAKQFEKNQKLYKLISPTGIVLTMYSIPMKDFCLKNNLKYASMVQAARRNIFHRGWKSELISPF
jgi:hypothetical protein